MSTSAATANLSPCTTARPPTSSGRHLLTLLEPAVRVHPSAGTDVEPARGKLTPRERQVLRMVAAGDTGQDIASELVLSPETVSTHMRNIREKLGARSRAHALAVAVNRGEIEI